MTKTQNPKPLHMTTPMPDVTQEDVEVCCDGMRNILEKYPASFERRPLLADGGEWTKPYIIMWLYPTTASGRISESKRSWTYVVFCPCCGKQLIPYKEVADA